jgi:hypothetical protein
VHLFGKEASGKKTVKGVDKATAGLSIVPIDDPRQGLQTICPHSTSTPLPPLPP